MKLNVCMFILPRNGRTSNQCDQYYRHGLVAKRSCILLVNLLHFDARLALSRDLGTSCASIDQFVDCVCVDMTWEVVLVMIQGARSLTTAHQENPPREHTSSFQ